MAGTRKVGEKIPLAVVGKDGITEDQDRDDSTMTDADRQSTIRQLTENLAALRSQLDTLSTSLAKVSGKAGKAVAHGAESATESVTSTVRAYPFYAVFAASAAAFLLGRMSVATPQTFSDRAYDQLRDVLRMASSRLPSNIVDSVRSSIR